MITEEWVKETRHKLDRYATALTSTPAVERKARVDLVTHLRQPLGADKSSFVYYMRDDHTFVPLPLDFDEARLILRRQFERGMCHGLVCSKHTKLVDYCVPARGNHEFKEFVDQVKLFLAFANEAFCNEREAK